MDPDFYPNVDWMDLILKNGAWSYRANLNMNGGGNTARYFVSASYTEDQGMYNTDQTYVMITIQMPTIKSGIIV